MYTCNVPSPDITAVTSDTILLVRTELIAFSMGSMAFGTTDLSPFDVDSVGEERVVRLTEIGFPRDFFHRGNELLDETFLCFAGTDGR